MRVLSPCAKSVMPFPRRFNGEPVVAYQPSLSPDLSVAWCCCRRWRCLREPIHGRSSRNECPSWSDLSAGYARALFHLRLASGDFGRNVMKWSGICMLPIPGVRRIPLVADQAGAHPQVGWRTVLVRHAQCDRNLLIVASPGNVSGNGNCPWFRRSHGADDLQTDPVQPDPCFSRRGARTSTRCCTNHTG